MNVHFARPTDATPVHFTTTARMVFKQEQVIRMLRYET